MSTYLSEVKLLPWCSLFCTWSSGRSGLVFLVDRLTPFLFSLNLVRTSLNISAEVKLNIQVRLLHGNLIEFVPLLVMNLMCAGVPSIKSDSASLSSKRYLIMLLLKSAYKDHRSKSLGHTVRPGSSLSM
jgi:hypothetical protein